MPKNYIDLRLNLDFEEESYEDIDGKAITERFLDGIDIEVTNIFGVEPEELIGISESLSQMDKYQIILPNDIPSAIYDYGQEHSAS
jgi:hypothetical protein